MKRSEIYREAARRLSERLGDKEESYSCDQIYFAAVNCASYGERGELRETYAELFSPRDYRPLFWLRCAAMRRAERDNWRVTALCFMAAISEWEERNG
jgi:hypothetical protein